MSSRKRTLRSSAAARQPPTAPAATTSTSTTTKRTTVRAARKGGKAKPAQLELDAVDTEADEKQQQARAAADLNSPKPPQPKRKRPAPAAAAADDEGPSDDDAADDDAFVKPTKVRKASEKPDIDIKAMLEEQKRLLEAAFEQKLQAATHDLESKMTAEKKRQRHTEKLQAMLQQHVIVRGGDTMHLDEPEMNVLEHMCAWIRRKPGAVVKLVYAAARNPGHQKSTAEAAGDIVLCALTPSGARDAAAVREMNEHVNRHVFFAYAQLSSGGSTPRDPGVRVSVYQCDELPQQQQQQQEAGTAAAAPAPKLVERVTFSTDRDAARYVAKLHTKTITEPIWVVGAIALADSSEPAFLAQSIYKCKRFVVRSPYTDKESAFDPLQEHKFAPDKPEPPMASPPPQPQQQTQPQQGSQYDEKHGGGDGGQTHSHSHSFQQRPPALETTGGGGAMMDTEEPEPATPTRLFVSAPPAQGLGAARRLFGGAALATRTPPAAAAQAQSAGFFATAHHAHAHDAHAAASWRQADPLPQPQPPAYQPLPLQQTNNDAEAHAILHALVAGYEPLNKFAHELKGLYGGANVGKPSLLAVVRALERLLAPFEAAAERPQALEAMLDRIQMALTTQGNAGAPGATTNKMVELVMREPHAQQVLVNEANKQLALNRSLKSDLERLKRLGQLQQQQQFGGGGPGFHAAAAPAPRSTWV